MAWELVNTEGVSIEGGVFGANVLCRKVRAGELGAEIGPMVEPMLQRATQLQVSHSPSFTVGGRLRCEGGRPIARCLLCHGDFRIDALFTAASFSMFSIFLTVHRILSPPVPVYQEGPALEKLLQCIAAAAVQANSVTGLLSHALLGSLPAKRFLSLVRAVGEETSTRTLNPNPHLSSAVRNSTQGRRKTPSPRPQPR